MRLQCGIVCKWTMYIYMCGELKAIVSPTVGKHFSFCNSRFALHAAQVSTCR